MDAKRDNRVDAILYELSVLHSNVGIDSTAEELDVVKLKEKYWKDKIADLDQDLADRLFP